LPSRYEVRISGFGGQGVKVAGMTLSRAAVNEKRFVVQTESYGPEARGGACRSDIVISDAPVDYPFVRAPDALIVMSLEALQRYINGLKPAGLLLYDSNLVKVQAEREGIRLWQVPASSIAANLGNKIAANMVLLGALLQLTGIVSKEAVESILGRASFQMANLNIQALREGAEYVRGKENRD
jgi:2-oxoglutarate ferredoxin oxidoreductase subunit gamma